jgi:hypothetical protein
LHHYTIIAEQFTPHRHVLDVHEFGNGNINDTYLVTTDSNEETHFVLQRINTQVFKHPNLIMQNMRIFTEHMRRRAREEGHRWEMPRVLNTCEGKDFLLDSENNFWRAISYVHGARSYDTISNLDHARAVGYALGTFQSLISDLPVGLLADTLEGFHIMPRYLEHFDKMYSHNGFVSNSEVRFSLDFVEARRSCPAHAPETFAGPALTTVTYAQPPGRYLAPPVRLIRGSTAPNSFFCFRSLHVDWPPSAA